MANYSGGGAAFQSNWHGHGHGPMGRTTVQIEGAWTGAIAFEARSPSTGAVVPWAVTPVGGGAAVTSLAAGEVGIWSGDSSGVEVRARFTPGTGNPTLRVTDAYSG